MPESTEKDAGQAVQPSRIADESSTEPCYLDEIFAVTTDSAVPSHRQNVPLMVHSSQSKNLQPNGDPLSRRYALRDRSILRWVMDHPGTGAPFSVRTLAQASCCGKGVIEGLLTGHQKTAS